MPQKIRLWNMYKRRYYSTLHYALKKKKATHTHNLDDVQNVIKTRKSWSVQKPLFVRSNS